MTPRSRPTTPRDHTRACSTRAGFTLVEMVVSLVVISVLLVGMGSAVVLASKALPHNDSASSATLVTTTALQDFRDELAAATELLNRSATSVTLHLPDRDGDGHPEVITYAWSGTAGDPLTRASNGGTARTILDSVRGFSLTYSTTTHDTIFPGPTDTSAEIELSSYSPSTSSYSLNINDPNLIGFRFTPTLPTDASSWEISRVLMKTTISDDTLGQITFELTGWDDGVGPNNALKASSDVPEADLDQGFGWFELAFATSGSFTPGDTAAITLYDTGDGAGGRVLFNTSESADNALFSNNNGSSWNISTSGVAHYVYGTYETPSDDWTYAQDRIESVDIQINQGNASAITHHLAVLLPNAPVAADALWEADFNADPTTLDLDGDGVSSWQDDGNFDTTKLSNGRWEVTGTMSSNPGRVTLDEPFTLDLWIRDAVDNSTGGGVELRFNRSGGDHAFIVIEANLESTGQVITVHYQAFDGTMVEAINQTQPDGEMIHVALTVDPVNETAGVQIDGEVVDSFLFDPITSSSTDTLRPFVDSAGGDVYLDHLRLTTGGAITMTPDPY